MQALAFFHILRTSVTAPSCIGGPLYLSDGLKTDRQWFRSKDNANKVRLRLKASKQAYGMILLYAILLDRPCVLHCCSCYTLFVQRYVTGKVYLRSNLSRNAMSLHHHSVDVKMYMQGLHPVHRNAPTNAILHSIIAGLLHVDHTTFNADIKSTSYPKS